MEKMVVGREDVSCLVVVVADVGNNADLYAANQESTELINEAHMT